MIRDNPASLPMNKRRRSQGMAADYGMNSLLLWGTHLMSNSLIQSPEEYSGQAKLTVSKHNSSICVIDAE
jgi:hypothetical protein